MAAADRQKQLQAFIKRRHPLYDAMEAHWDFLEQTYEGGREWFESHIFKYIKEGDAEFKDRKARAFRFNHTREVVDLVTKYLFKMEVTRRTDEAPECVQNFWKKATLNEASIIELMKRVSNRASTFGRPWVVVDNNNVGQVVTVSDEKKSGARVYAYIVTPQNVLDMSYDDEGKLNWILLREVDRDDADPIASSGNLIDGYRLWTRDSSQLFTVKKEGNKVTIIEESPVFHNLGVVPVVPADDTISDNPYTSPAMIADVAYLDRAVANYLSNLDAIIQDQTFSQLVIPAEALETGTVAYDKLVEMGTKRIFTYVGGSKGPEFISPDVKQAEVILKVVNKIINEIYHSVGLAGERTKEDNALGIDNSSGVAKAYDFERVNSLLAAKADSIQMVENKIAWLVARWHGVEDEIDEIGKPLVLYPENFDVRGLYDEFEIAARLTLLEAPDEVRREQMTRVVDKLFPQLKEDLRTKIINELKTWPPKVVVEDPGNSGPAILGKTSKTQLAAKLVKT